MLSNVENIHLFLRYFLKVIAKQKEKKKQKLIKTTWNDNPLTESCFSSENADNYNLYPLIQNLINAYLAVYLI